MSKTTMIDEIQVLRFFETGSLEKAEVVFKIVCEKMKDRLRDRQEAESENTKEKTVTVRRRSAAGQSPSFGQTENTDSTA